MSKYLIEGKEGTGFVRYSNVAIRHTRFYMLLYIYIIGTQHDH